MPEPDPVELDEAVIIEPDELLTVGEFVALVTEMWEACLEDFERDGQEEFAENMEIAIGTLQSTFSAREMCDLSQYERQLSGQNASASGEEEKQK